MGVLVIIYRDYLQKKEGCWNIIACYFTRWLRHLAPGYYNRKIKMRLAVRKAVFWYVHILFHFNGCGRWW